MASTAVRTIARAAFGIAVAGMVLGSAGTAFADEAPVAAAPTPAAAAHTLHLSGSVAGTIAAGHVECAKLADASWSWTATGTAGDGSPVTITFNTNNFHGTGQYATTGVTDDKGGLATLSTDTVQVSTNADTVGRFTVDRGEHSGSIDTDLTDAPNGLTVHVSGTWACA